jgi:hypothetical protein
MTHRSTNVLFAVALAFAGLMIRGANAQQSSQPVKAVHLTGLAGVKDNAKGTLKVEGGQLHFVHAKESSDVRVTAIEDVVTGADTQAAAGKTISTISIAAPYESGRFLALFRTKIDTLTLRYRDGEGALHGAIFTMPGGGAEAIKKDLVAHGAHTTAAEEHRTTPAPPSNPPGKEQRQ